MSSKPYRVGQWIPSDQKVLDKWLDNLITEVKSKSKDNLALLMAVQLVRVAMGGILSK